MRGARAVTNAVPIHIGTFDASDDDSWFRSQRGGVALSVDAYDDYPYGWLRCGLRRRRRRRWKTHRYALDDDDDGDDGERVMYGD